MAIHAYVLLTVKSGSEREVSESISKYDAIREVSEVYGEYDVLAKVEAEDLPQLDNLLTYRIRSNPSVLLTYTMIIAKAHKG